MSTKNKGYKEDLLELISLIDSSKKFSKNDIINNIKLILIEHNEVYKFALNRGYELLNISETNSNITVTLNRAESNIDFKL